MVAKVTAAAKKRARAAQRERLAKLPQRVNAPRPQTRSTESGMNAIAHLNALHEGHATLTPGNGPDAIPMTRYINTNIGAFLGTAYDTYGVAMCMFPGTASDVALVAVLEVGSATGADAANFSIPVPNVTLLSTGAPGAGTDYSHLCRKTSTSIKLTYIGNPLNAKGYICFNDASVLQIDDFKNEDLSQLSSNVRNSSRTHRLPISALARMGSYTLKQPSMTGASDEFKPLRKAGTVQGMFDHSVSGITENLAPCMMTFEGIDRTDGNVMIEVREHLELLPSFVSDITLSGTNYNMFAKPRSHASADHVATVRKVSGPTFSEQAITNFNKSVPGQLLHPAIAFVRTHAEEIRGLALAGLKFFGAESAAGSGTAGSTLVPFTGTSFLLPP